VVVPRRVRPSSTVTSEDLAAELEGAPLARSAAGVEPASIPSGRSEIAHDIARLARIIAARRVRRSVAVEVSAERSGRAINASQVINRKQVQVQRRRAFSIHVG
jgi:hypothetical protein